MRHDDPKAGESSATRAMNDATSPSVEVGGDSIEDPFTGEEIEEKEEEEEEFFDQRPRTFSEDPNRNIRQHHHEEERGRPRRSSLEVPNEIKLQKAVRLKENGTDMFFESQYFDALELFKKVRRK